MFATASCSPQPWHELKRVHDRRSKPQDEQWQLRSNPTRRLACLTACTSRCDRPGLILVVPLMGGILPPRPAPRHIPLSTLRSHHPSALSGAVTSDSAVNSATPAPGARVRAR